MNINVTQRLSRNKQKVYYSLDWGRAGGQRMSTGVFIYLKPKDQIQRNHNKEALLILETKRSQMILDRQSISTWYIPQHKVKTNFLDYYAEFVRLNPTKGNRHLASSFHAFEKFISSGFISPVEITENFCERFRGYLLANYNGETPANYFMRFKRVLKVAKKEGYFINDPGADIAAKANKNKIIKEILSEDDYMKLMNTPCTNHEVKKAFVFSLYTGLRWVDVKPLKWENVKEKSILLQQHKTGINVEIPLHEIARLILGERKTGPIFHLPTQDGSNKVLGIWCNNAGLHKHITWHCARHSFSVLLQQKGIDLATVSGMLGHTTTKYVQQTYKRYLQNSAVEAIKKLPGLNF
ncbi:MAG: site-specific integrase [Bacteroidota bacterium]|nr:site-specific integrase [Bacteroidota bacterium]